MLSGQCDVAVRVASKEVHSATKVEEWHSRCQLASCQCECHRTPTEAGTKKRVWRLLPALGAVMLLAACDTTKATQTFGEVIVRGPQPTIVVERTPSLHFDAAPEIGTPLVVEPCVEHDVEVPEDHCAYVVVVP